MSNFIGAVEDEWQLFSDNAQDYTIGPPIGFGASSIVYAATYHPPSPNSSSRKAIQCALKVLDLDSLPPRSLQLLQRETALMSLSKHPNVLRVRGSWMDGHKLHIALRLMNKGSAADVMRYGWPEGMEEDVVRCILWQALNGLNYLHTNGFIHRDVKAANLLIDDDGTVLLGDLGVAADLSEDTSQIYGSSSKAHFITAKAALESSTGKYAVSLNSVCTAVPRPRIRKRKSFVGTPCWMAPEIIEGKQYDFSADIWSFGITALELTQGRPPRSRESPQRVLLKTVQEEPPTLNREGGVSRYSRAFKEVIDGCLVKDPSKRPSAAGLLQTPFFKAVKKKSYLINTILKDLPPLTQRQERYALPRVTSGNYIDSWDFATTIHTPTPSLHKRPALESFAPAAVGAKKVTPPSSSSAGTTKFSGVLSSHMATSQTSAPAVASSPMFYAASSGITPRSMVTVSTPIPHSQRPTSTMARHKSHPAFGDSQPTQKSRASPEPTLWHKIKNNVIRPVSLAEAGDSEDPPRKDKEKGRGSNSMLSF
ncbi:hypothetical protein GALMADRAFT_71443 [Galerina marginata CBS 339.88]|uniref:Protein kinase domain-containing protein n=1 Tax=Galerina marginata (strain CBS 339.88) TaxID=685588 RepID=A0A067ST26_GALM3|nr:hypothetical protein GALMADRAFT_71443 [Galerina marginata CBS 339.88]